MNTIKEINRLYRESRRNMQTKYYTDNMKVYEHIDSNTSFYKRLPIYSLYQLYLQCQSLTNVQFNVDCKFSLEKAIYNLNRVSVTKRYSLTNVMAEYLIKFLFKYTSLPYKYSSNVSKPKIYILHKNIKKYKYAIGTLNVNQINLSDIANVYEYIAESVLPESDLLDEYAVSALCDYFKKEDPGKYKEEIFIQPDDDRFITLSNDSDTEESAKDTESDINEPDNRQLSDDDELHEDNQLDDDNYGSDTDQIVVGRFKRIVIED